MMQTIQQYLSSFEWTSLGWTWLGLAALAAVVLCAVVGFRRGFVKEVFSVCMIFLSIGIVWLVNPYVNDFLREYTPIYSSISESAHIYVDSKFDSAVIPDSEEQMQMIEDLDLPDFLTEGLETDNQAAIYSALGVTSFADYVVDYIAGIIINGVSFVVSFVLANLLLRILSFLLDLTTKLPVIRGVNKLAGAFLGGSKCIVYIWVLMLAATIFCNTELGKSILHMIEQDPLLKQMFLYNPLRIWFAQITYAR